MESRTTGTYNAGSGASVGVQELASIISALSGSAKPIISSGKQRPNEIPDVVADISRARQTFGWVPQVDLSDGLRETIDDTQVTLAGAR
jgi:nucleoside-diphosphate-sugar epimerase